ncbi:hypothetical protein E2C01_086587 [Portunus trituberculatus]|uniref:Uncharacterized protein n=1 Tax=Portunus trituberculatus TaxID=210409 RepID=A0A5B7J5T8_PORTR|nr:hypothetical protein [Portunus trituberculatus]
METGRRQSVERITKFDLRGSSSGLARRLRWKMVHGSEVVRKV